MEIDTPWRTDGEGLRMLVRSVDGRIVALRHRENAETHAAYFRRIAAAVNAVAGMPQDDLEELAKVEGGVMSLTVYADDMRQRVEKLEADYAAQGLALKAAKAMQAGETERADRADKWRQAIDDALIVAHLGTAEHDDDPVVLLEKLIKWHVDVALDPAVSEKAIALIEAEREACAQVSLAVMKNPYADRVRWVAKQIASDIRARGKKGF